MKYLFSLCCIIIGVFLVMGCTQPFTQATPATPSATSVATTTAPITTIPTTPSVSANTIIIQKMTFVPSQITVHKGEIVRWVNEDTVAHSIVFDPKTKITTYLLAPSQSSSISFANVGVYNYTCGIYSSMQGSVNVAE